MTKVSVPTTNDFCPQTLFLFGTFKEDGQPNFGLFCWFSYCWLDGLGVMASIGGSKLTLDRIRAAKVFSANLVTEANLALADHFGSVDGHAPEKMAVPFSWERGAVLDVPVLGESPLAFELEVERFVPLDDEDCVTLLCKVRNVLADPILADAERSIEEKLRRIAPVSTTCMTYFGWQGERLGAWHEPAKRAWG